MSLLGAALSAVLGKILLAPQVGFDQVRSVTDLLASWCALFLSASLILNNLFRLLVMQQWRFRRARGPLACSSVLAALLVVLGVYGLASRANELVLTFGFAIELLWPFFESIVRRVVADEGGLSATRVVGEMRIFGLSLNTIAHLARTVLSGRAAESLLSDPGPDDLSPMKVVVGTTIVVLFLTHAALAAGQEVTRRLHASSPSTLQAAHPLQGTSGGKHGAAGAEKTLTWDGVCGAHAPLPGAGAPAWAAKHLYDLFLGAGGPGASIAGCPTPPHLSPAGDFVYVISHRSGSALIRSVAVDSHRYGPALFLSPAASIVVDLMSHVGEVGGTSRVSVGDGDLYLIYDVQGTVALVRARKVSPSNSVSAQPYVLLPPSAVDAWLSAIRQLDEWLWPLDPVQLSDGELLYGLTSDAVTNALDASVIFDPGSTRSRLMLNGNLIPFGPGGRHVPSVTLSSLLPGRVRPGAN